MILERCKYNLYVQVSIGSKEQWKKGVYTKNNTTLQFLKTRKHKNIIIWVFCLFALWLAKIMQKFYETTINLWPLIISTYTSCRSIAVVTWLLHVSCNILVFEKSVFNVSFKTGYDSKYSNAFLWRSCIIEFQLKVRCMIEQKKCWKIQLKFS